MNDNNVNYGLNNNNINYSINNNNNTKNDLNKSIEFMVNNFGSSFIE